MYYAKARLYDTADKHGSTKGNKLGDKRFMAVDPVKGDTRNPQSMVQYTYTLNNPLMYVDPLGLFYERAIVYWQNNDWQIDYVVEKESYFTIGLKSIAQAADSTEILADPTIDKVEGLLNIVGGSSARNVEAKALFDTASKAAAINAASNLAGKGEIKTLGSFISGTGSAYFALNELGNNLPIRERDDIAFKLLEIAEADVNLRSKVRGEGSYRMSLMYNLIESDRDYFYGYFFKIECQFNNSKMTQSKSDTPFETDISIINARDSQKRIDKLVNKYKDVLKNQVGWNDTYADAYREYLNGYLARLDYYKEMTRQNAQAIFMYEEE